jgi:hypothetical protein
MGFVVVQDRIMQTGFVVLGNELGVGISVVLGRASWLV